MLLDTMFLLTMYIAHDMLDAGKQWPGPPIRLNHGGNRFVKERPSTKLQRILSPILFTHSIVYLCIDQDLEPIVFCCL